ncbi:NACHT domain-containing protein [Polaromonas sp. CT11-55]|uniref:NACHT domain-containing protein n=1 Tax=Polaromonas sp. CT11-55 TaxID=3243045 RepID=UPI0039A513F0
MDFESKKLLIAAITDEVNVLHPLLSHLLRHIEDVTDVEYMHGPNEKGADFVVSRRDVALNTIHHIGVVAKVGKILQNFDDVARQVEECQQSRGILGGMTQVRLSEVWVINTSSISKNAEDKIQDKYRAQKITFIDGERLTTLVDKYADYFWYDVPTNVGSYLQELSARLINLDAELSVLKGLKCSDFYVSPEIQEFSKSTYSRHTRPQKARLVNLQEVVRKEGVSFLEGDMGYGKSKTARAIALYYTAPERFKQFGVIPIFTSFRSFSDSGKSLAEILVDETKKYFRADDYPTSEILFVIDGVDEAIKKGSNWQDRLQSAIKEARNTSKFHLLLTSRPLRLLDEPTSAYAGSTRYELRPLSLSKLINFVEQACSNMSLPKRLFEDLQKSDLFKQLPQSPIAAALLSRLISQNTNDLPSNLTELYSKSVENLLGRWDVDKGGCTEKEFRDAERVTLVLTEYIVENQLPHMNYAEAVEQIDQWHKERNTNVSLDALKDRVFFKSGIFMVDEEQGLLAFRHRSFGEFLFALASQRNNRPPPIQNSFNAYWVVPQYFYTGLLGDCKQHLHALLSHEPKNEAESWLKILFMPDYFLAGYQTPYSIVEENLYKLFLDAAHLFNRIRGGDTKTKLAELPEMHLLWFFQRLIRNCFEYEFFRKSITTTLLKIDGEMADPKIKELALFFASCYAAELGDSSGFEFLLKHHPTEKLQLSVALAIKVEQETNKDFTKLSILKTHDKKLQALLTSGRDHKLLNGLETSKALDDLFEKPVKSRKIDLRP